MIGANLAGVVRWDDNYGNLTWELWQELQLSIIG